jgi:hypothetical protein
VTIEITVFSEKPAAAIFRKEEQFLRIVGNDIPSYALPQSTTAVYSVTDAETLDFR